MTLKIEIRIPDFTEGMSFDSEFIKNQEDKMFESYFPKRAGTKEVARKVKMLSELEEKIYNVFVEYMEGSGLINT